jgi:hypothetical protein
MVGSARRSRTGAVIVVAIAIGVWWVRVPGLTSFVFIPPLVLGIGVGLVARYSTARTGVLVATAAATTAMLFGFVVARWSSYGVHGDALGNTIAVGAFVVAEAALAAGAGPLIGC